MNAVLRSGLSGTVDDEMTLLMVENESTEALVTQARNGDRVAYGRLAERFIERLRSLVQSRLGPALREDLEVEDVVQETFRLGLEGIERFAWQGEESFLRWLGTISENLIRKNARTKARRPAMEEILEIEGSGTSPSVHLRREERFDRLQQALESLPPDYREVIRLSRIEGKKTSEIATLMGRSSSAVKQLLFRALRRLRESFGETETLHLPDRRFDAESDA